MQTQRRWLRLLPAEVLHDAKQLRDKHTGVKGKRCWNGVGG